MVDIARHVAHFEGWRASLQAEQVAEILRKANTEIVLADVRDGDFVRSYALTGEGFVEYFYPASAPARRGEERFPTDMRMALRMMEDHQNNKDKSAFNIDTAYNKFLSGCMKMIHLDKFLTETSS